MFIRSWDCYPTADRLIFSVSGKNRIIRVRPKGMMEHNCSSQWVIKSSLLLSVVVFSVMRWSGTDVLQIQRVEMSSILRPLGLIHACFLLIRQALVHWEAGRCCWNSNIESHHSVIRCFCIFQMSSQCDLRGIHCFTSRVGCSVLCKVNHTKRLLEEWSHASEAADQTKTHKWDFMNS